MLKFKDLLGKTVFIKKQGPYVSVKIMHSLPGLKEAAIRNPNGLLVSRVVYEKTTNMEWVYLEGFDWIAIADIGGNNAI